MLVEFDKAEDGARFDADICIVGAGAAGITLARALAGSGLEICLIESGGGDYDRHTQSLYEGEITGRPYYALAESRLRFFGGTTAIWGGRCVPMDPIDFETRPGIAGSGWPLAHADLIPYFRRAAQLFELPFERFDSALWEMLRSRPPAFDPARLQTAFWQFDAKYWRFGLGNCGDLVASPRIRILTRANVTEIETDGAGGRVTGLCLAALSGPRGHVTARAYVLACGGIENARLLLASNRACPAGLGNGRDLVGRYFMEHPHARIAELDLADPYALWARFRKQFTVGGHKLIPALRLGDELQRREGVLNTAVTVKFQHPPEAGVPISQAVYETLRKHGAPNQWMRRLWRLYRQSNDSLQAWGERPLRRYQLRRGRGRLYLIARAEQAPNPDSRVTLGAGRDALGLPRPELDWRLSEVDTRTLQVLVATMDDELRRLGLGRARPMPWLEAGGVAWPVDPTLGRHPIGGYHHMGTTRMADDPRCGVVDSDSRVHGVANLYIAGSSVFPTGGWANPTMTLVALCLRLADHLGHSLARPVRASASSRAPVAASLAGADPAAPHAAE